MQLKVNPDVTISRHTPAGEVHVRNASGSRRQDTGEIAGPSPYVRKSAGDVDFWSCVGDEPCIVQVTMSRGLAFLGANDDLLDYIDAPRLRGLYLPYCGKGGFEPIAIGAAA